MSEERSSPTPVSSTLGLPLLASLTLGLAPFFPEPHLVGKLRWVAGGAKRMQPMDWLDLLFHGAPWVWLAGALAVTATVAVIRPRGSSS